MTITCTVRGNFARNNRELVKRVLKQDKAAALWAGTHYSRAVNIFADATNSTLREVTKTYPIGDFYLDPTITDTSIASLLQQAIVLRENNQLKGAIDWKIYIDKSFL